MPKQLREYQKIGIQTLREHKRYILADDVGLGKTVQIIGSSQSPVLIICPSRAINTWVEEIQFWTKVDPYDIVVYRGTPKQRQTIALDLQSEMAKFVICTYQMMPEIQQKVSKRWKTIVFDEAHILRNRQTGKRTLKTLYPTAKKFYAYRMYMVTATPVINGAKDLWTLLNLIDAKNFRSYWKFVNEYCIVYNDGFGTKVEGTNPHAAAQLNNLLSNYMIKRTASDVGLQLPSFDRQYVTLDMTERQKHVYRELSTEAMTLLENGEFLLTPNILAKFTRLRQLLVTPRLLSIDDDGASIQALQAEAESLNEPIAIFTPFREAIPYIEYALSDVGYESYIVVGGMDENRIKHSIDTFLSGKGKRAMIATSQMGTSWSIPGVRLSYTIGFEWRPTDHEQCEGRLGGGFRRTVPVLSKYFIHEGTIDTHMKNILNRKVLWRDLALLPDKLLRPKRDT